MAEDYDVTAKSQQRSLSPAIAEAFKLDHPDHGMLVLRWVLVADVVTDDGNRELTWLSSEDSTPWEARGMLNEAHESWGGE